MIIYSIICLFTLFGIYLLIKYIIDKKKSGYGDVDLLFGWTVVLIGFGTALLIITGTWISVSTKETNFDSEYNSTIAIIEKIEKRGSCFNYGNESELTKKVLELNKEIAKNKAYSENPFINLWYSEEIGNYEPLKLP